MRQTARFVKQDIFLLNVLLFLEGRFLFFALSFIFAFFFNQANMSKYISTIGFLFLSNAFMTMAWYGHLKFFAKGSTHSSTPLWAIVLLSWSLAFFEYCFQVPANRIGSSEMGGPFSIVQLKVIQEVITLVVFMVFSVVFFKNVHFTLNHLIGFCFLVVAVYFIFKQ